MVQMVSYALVSHEMLSYEMVAYEMVSYAVVSYEMVPHASNAFPAAKGMCLCIRRVVAKPCVFAVQNLSIGSLGLSHIRILLKGHFTKTFTKIFTETFH